ncbi:endonuclease domain-containing protein, partial [Klebsiella pneumoniae]|uniref:endonuclease domain-containing protein n=1 Tax=Klebsiella pneumoniae TaxID=573 RepID=UPI0025A089E5
AREEEEFQAADCCHICHGTLNDDSVRDHDHLTGKFRGAAHNGCNLQWRLDPKRYKLPIFFHNLRGYDSHLLVKAFAKQEKWAGR